MIEFLCPNEHKIRCPDDKAGRPAKCPKCGVSFRIPTLEELSIGASSLASEAPPEATEVPEPAASPSGSGVQVAAPAAVAAKDRQIEFLCPNGHHLHGPATLQGRAGECPECGSRFRIPVVDTPEPGAEQLLEPQLAGDAEAAPEEITLESPEVVGGNDGGAGTLEFLQVLDGGGSGEGRPASGVVSADMLGFSPSGEGGVHPLAALFIELWAARDEASRVEIHLESGSVLAPDAYVKSHSLADYAVFLTKDPDGAATVTVVPWSSIARIILRALKKVPGDVVG